MATKNTSKAPGNTECRRCTGNGRIEAFRHVQNGICFRCWGTGCDPRTVTELERWLDTARAEYRRLRAAGEENSVAAKQIVREGKRAARKVEALKAETKMAHANAVL